MYVLLPTGRQARRGSNWFLQHFLHSGGGGCGGGGCSRSCGRACCQRTHAWYWCMGELKQNWLITPSCCRFLPQWTIGGLTDGWIMVVEAGFFFFPFEKCVLMSSEVMKVEVRVRDSKVVGSPINQSYLIFWKVSFWYCSVFQILGLARKRPYARNRIEQNRIEWCSHLVIILTFTI